MQTIGQYLRKEREAKHISIEEVVLHTRIQPQFIEAIEEENFDQIPSPVSAKGFLKSYTRFLQLDEKETLKQFASLSPPVTLTPPVELYKEPISRMGIVGEKNTDDLYFYRFLKVFASGILLVFVFMILVSLWSKKSESPSQTQALLDKPPMMNRNPPADLAAPSPLVADRTTAPTEDLSSTAPPIAPTVGLPALDVTKPAPKVPTSTSVRPLSRKVPLTPPDPPLLNETRNPTPVSSPPAEPLILSIEADEPTWVQVIIDEKKTREVLLQKGETIVWKAENTFQLTTGNAGGAKVFLNSKALGLLGKRGEVIKGYLISRSALSPDPAQ